MLDSETKAVTRCLLDVEDGVGGVGGGLVLGRVTDEAFLLGEGDVGRSDTVTLIVDENLDLALLHHTDTAVGRTQILLRKVVSIWRGHERQLELLTIPMTVP